VSEISIFSIGDSKPACHDNYKCGIDAKNFDVVCDKMIIAEICTGENDA
jgi:hypothetical protein